MMQNWSKTCVLGDEIDVMENVVGLVYFFTTYYNLSSKHISKTIGLNLVVLHCNISFVNGVQ